MSSLSYSAALQKPKPVSKPTVCKPLQQAPPTPMNALPPKVERVYCFICAHILGENNPSRHYQVSYGIEKCYSCKRCLHACHIGWGCGGCSNCPDECWD